MIHVPLVTFITEKYSITGISFFSFLLFVILINTRKKYLHENFTFAKVPSTLASYTITHLHWGTLGIHPIFLIKNLSSLSPKHLPFPVFILVFLSISFSSAGILKNKRTYYPWTSLDGYWPRSAWKLWRIARLCS